MSTTTAATPATAPTGVRRIEPIPFTRVVGVELRKMFDTRAGAWLVTSVAITALLVSAAVVTVAPDSLVSFTGFSSAIGIPMSIVLPLIAVLSVTGEHTQRTGLSTYTLVPQRSRVVAAKLAAVLLMSLAALTVALGIGALGNLLGSTVRGFSPVWDVSATDLGHILLALTLTMLVGFMLGVVMRGSTPAIVAYAVYTAILPAASNTLAAFQGWFADLQPWVDLNHSLSRLYDSAMPSEAWAQLGVTTVVWLVVPTVVGVRLLLRAEVK